MNPQWFLVGVAIGDRIKWNRPWLEKKGRKLVKRARRIAHNEAERWRLLDSAHRDLESLPVTDERG